MNQKTMCIQMRSVPCGRGELTFQLTRKSVKNVNLRIKPDGRILVSANRRVSVAFIDDFVRRNQDYIYRALDRFQEAREKRLEEASAENSAGIRQYVSGESILVLGKRLTLEVVAAGQGIARGVAQDAQESAAAGQGIARGVAQDAQENAAAEQGIVQCAMRSAAGEGVWVRGGCLVLAVKDPGNLARKAKLVDDWQKRLREETFARICREIYPAFAAYGIRYPQIKIRRMTSRWGSCQPARGIITLNSRLIEAPRESIEYVALHEFAHFIHPNHSREFYGLVESLMPDWRERKGKLP